METKGITCRIPLALHQRVSEDIRQEGSTMNRFIEKVIQCYYEKGAGTMNTNKTLAIQISSDLQQRIKTYLLRYEQVHGKHMSQREFIVTLIENALAEADEEFEAARAAAHEQQQETREGGE